MKKEKLNHNIINEIVSLGISKIEAKELLKVTKNIKKDLKALKKGYPIQYLIGYVNFCGNKITVNKNVLIPRYETEFLVEKVLKYIKHLEIKNPVILDLCTGSGCIAISLKKELKDSIVYASDISNIALKVAKRNIKLNNVKINLIKSDLFKKIKNIKFDIIISNPPYVSKKEKLSKELKYEPKLAIFSKEEGFYHTNKIIKESKKYLKNKSILAIESNFNLNKKFKGKEYIIEKDLTGRNRYLFIINE